MSSGRGAAVQRFLRDYSGARPGLADRRGPGHPAGLAPTVFPPPAQSSGRPEQGLEGTRADPGKQIRVRSHVCRTGSSKKV